MKTKFSQNGETYSEQIYLGEGSVEWKEFLKSEIPVEVNEEFTEYEMLE